MPCHIAELYTGGGALPATQVWLARYTRATLLVMSVKFPVYMMLLTSLPRGHPSPRPYPNFVGDVFTPGTATETLGGTNLIRFLKSGLFLLSLSKDIDFQSRHFSAFSHSTLQTKFVDF